MYIFLIWSSLPDRLKKISEETHKIPKCVYSINTTKSDPLIPNIESFLKKIKPWLDPNSPVNLGVIKNIIMRLREASFLLGREPELIIYNIGIKGQGAGGSRFCFPYYPVFPDDSSDLSYLFQFLNNRAQQKPNVAFIGSADSAEAHVNLALAVCGPNIFYLNRMRHVEQLSVRNLRSCVS